MVLAALSINHYQHAKAAKMATEIYGKATSYKLVAVKGANEENDDEED